MELKTYWWKGKDFPNLGDEFTQLVLSREFHIEPVGADFKQADLISTGSVLGWIRQSQESFRTTPQHVVGSGFMYEDTTIVAKDNLQIHSVRGFLSKQKLSWLKMDDVSLGDPGLIAPEIAKLGTPKSFSRLGLIPHYINVEKPAFLAQFAHLDPKVIDIRTDDIDAFMTEVSSCDYIISQSLHGLIFADSLGIPNAWLRLLPEETRKDFKYYDYFSSVDRSFHKGLVGAPKNFHELSQNSAVVDPKLVSRLQADIRRSFESALNELSSPAEF